MKKLTLSTVSIVVASWLLSVGLGVFAVPTTSYAEHYIVAKSGKCITPFRRGSKPGTKLVLHRGDCKRRGVISRALHFRYDTAQKWLIHQATGLCASYFRHHANDNRIVLDWCSDNKSLFTMLPGGYLLSGDAPTDTLRFRECVHVKGDGDDAELVLRQGCLPSDGALAFNMVHADLRFVSTMLVNPYTGWCVKAAPWNNSRLLLNSFDCSDYDPMENFRMLPSGAIEHSSGKCVHPLGGRTVPANDTPLVVHDGCTHDRIKFRMLEGGVIQHEASGLCVRKSRSAELQLQDHCVDEEFMKFQFVQDQSVGIKSPLK